jgi:hypothetical protein
MSHKRKVTYKTGEVGKRLRFRVENADGPINLTPYTITLNAKTAVDGSAVITGAACSKETQSGATLGYCYHDLTSTTAAVVAGEYLGELKLVNGSNVLYAPVDEDDEKTYFDIEVQTPLG